MKHLTDKFDSEGCSVWGPLPLVAVVAEVEVSVEQLAEAVQSQQQPWLASCEAGWNSSAAEAVEVLLEGQLR